MPDGEDDKPEEQYAREPQDRFPTQAGPGCALHGEVVELREGANARPFHAQKHDLDRSVRAADGQRFPLIVLGANRLPQVVYVGVLGPKDGMLHQVKRLGHLDASRLNGNLGRRTRYGDLDRAGRLVVDSWFAWACLLGRNHVGWRQGILRLAGEDRPARTMASRAGESKSWIVPADVGTIGDIVKVDDLCTRAAGRKR